MLRVLDGGGDVREGDEVRLAARPNPEWPLRRLATLLYSGRGLTTGKPLKRSEWAGSQAELEAAAALPQLADLEWKDELLGMLGRAKAAPKTAALALVPAPGAFLVAALAAAAVLVAYVLAAAAL